MAEALEEELVGAILEGNMVRCDLKTKTGQKCNIKHKMGPDGKYAMKIHRRNSHKRYQCTSTNEWCYKTYSSHPKASAHFLLKHSGESESTEDPPMRIALGDVRDQKAARKNVLVPNNAPNSEISNLDMESTTKMKLLEDKIRELEWDLVASKEQSVELKRINDGHRAKIESLQRHLTNEQAEKASSRNDLSVALAENQDLRARLRREENHRRDQHEIIQELRGKIRTFCRIRAIPLEKITHLSIHNNTVKLTQMKPSASGERHSKHEFNFDQVFGPNATQQQVFDEIKPLIQSALDGYNEKLSLWKAELLDESEGIIPRTMRYILATCESLRALGWSYKIEASSLEIYNNRIRDLLGFPRGEHKIQTINNETVVTNLKVEEVTNEEQIQKLLAKAQQQRAVRTAMSIRNAAIVLQTARLFPSNLSRNPICVRMCEPYRIVVPSESASPAQHDCPR
ncbi:hypothetical protein DAPPUDRAFT_95626 [Daphnia pulex]|uniref:Kinesin motor domain-containing protein n=1 Tax=Daphnia pulex TaxID=6669 RepID=E9FW94_DAPPU|nr:hypothetical protein DAPPUDRAFT_95626 [Daphnia pulex]|eukprot:EFX88965.1 hypothetical protein DAPPUDRAFT_95626 [Daphnia pulex]